MLSPFIINCHILPVTFHYVESISSLMFHVQNKLAPVHVHDLFKHVSDIHSYNTRSAASSKFYAIYAFPSKSVE